jgi:hypothetical protein
MKLRNPVPRQGYQGTSALAVFDRFASSRAGRLLGDLSGARECVRCGYGWFPTPSAGMRHANIDGLDEVNGRLCYRLTQDDGMKVQWQAGWTLEEEPAPAAATATPKVERSPNEALVREPMEVVESSTSPNLPCHEIPFEIVPVDTGLRDYDEHVSQERGSLKERAAALQDRKGTVARIQQRGVEARLLAIEDERPVPQSEPPRHVATGSATSNGSEFLVTDLDAPPPAARRCCGCTIL